MRILQKSLPQNLLYLNLKPFETPICTQIHNQSSSSTNSTYPTPWFQFDILSQCMNQVTAIEFMSNPTDGFPKQGSQTLWLHLNMSYLVMLDIIKYLASKYACVHILMQTSLQCMGATTNGFPKKMNCNPINLGGYDCLLLTIIYYNNSISYT